MPQLAVEQRILNAMQAVFATVGGSSAWLTSPSVHQGTLPNDAIPDAGTTPQVYVQHVDSQDVSQGASSGSRVWRCTFSAYIYAVDPATVLAVKSDLLRALWAPTPAVAQASIIAVAGSAIWTAGFRHQTQMVRGGFYAGIQDFVTDAIVQFTSP